MEQNEPDIQDTKPYTSVEQFRDIYTYHTHTKAIKGCLQGKQKVLLKNLIASSPVMLFAALYRQQPHPALLVFDNKEQAAYFYTDLEKIIGKDHLAFFPASYKRSISKSSGIKTDNTNIIDRTEVLNRLTTNQEKLIIVTYASPLIEKVVSQSNLENHTLQLHKGEKINPEFIEEVLIEYGFERVDFVYEAGQYSLRGSIVDIFSYANDYPYRIDFFGEEVDSIRTFDTVTQLSKARFDKIAIIPDIQNRIDDTTRIPFIDFIAADTVVWIEGIRNIVAQMNDLYNRREEISDDTWTNGDYFKERLAEFSVFEMAQNAFFETNAVFEFNIAPQTTVDKNFNLLSEILFEYTEKGYTNYILSDGEKQIERLQAIFEARDDADLIDFKPVLTTIQYGFVDHDLRVCCYTDHQIFDRYRKFKLRKHPQASSKEALTLKEINDLKPGDYVVHVDHGIGRFGGLQTVEINNKKQEAIRLVYRDDDVLFVSIHSLHRISKYKGKDGTPPKIYKLGSNAWARLKQKTKKKVKDIAEELIKLYAKRKAAPGYSFAHDTYLQHALESSFIYEDTPDQLKATIETKQDMESEMPMDRLICGDVGFGKTEVAIRAAFKAVADNKQVAVLVPTTVLAFQHYNTFTSRLKDLPCNVDYISRLKTTKQQRETLKNLKAGKVDILIGTHRLLGKDIAFKDLGLLIIDEEQKFGVAMKEKLKRLKVNVDTLTLTATPIPRTMQFSLMGARDLSIIQTPPPNRYPIITELHTFNEDLIREAITYEVERNGQVFFIHNQVQNIAEVEAMINRICPEVRTAVAHGQMEGPKLEKIMLGFINEEYDVLIATTIIESGLDIPNANTIIINRAQNFGLSDLHQLRGRVGRSNRKAFCYLLAPPLTVVSQEARQRLKAIEQFSELGSGFNIALQDLDIRGAGNLLGGEQSGFISDIGFETYQRILEEALLELRENEFRDVFDNQPDEKQPGEKQQRKPMVSDRLRKMKFVTDCQVDTDFELLFPDAYISNVSERIKLYRELDNIDNEKQLKEFENQLTDRFGALPPQTAELLDVVRLRWSAINLGMEKIFLKNEKMICHFVSNQDSPFYNSPAFRAVLDFLRKYPQLCQLKEKKSKLTLHIKQVKTIKKARHILSEIEETAGNE